MFLAATLAVRLEACFVHSSQKPDGTYLVINAVLHMPADRKPALCATKHAKTGCPAGLTLATGIRHAATDPRSVKRLAGPPAPW